MTAHRVANLHLLAAQEEDVLSWDSDELNRVHNLHMREFTNLQVSPQKLSHHVSAILQRRL